MYFDTAFYSDYGGRDKNEDAVFSLVEDGRILALAADGLGGMGSGDLASADVIQFLLRHLQSGEIDEDRLCDGIQMGNQRIRQMQTDEINMMTTIAVLWADKRGAIAATVGDTRVYQFRNGKILFQSTDHSVAQMAVFSGEITADQIREFPGRNRLLRALGAEENTRVDLQDLTVLPADRFLLCTDGFWELITESQMQAFCLPEDTAAQWLNRMRSLVSKRSGPKGDNHSAITVILREGGNDE